MHDPMQRSEPWVVGHCTIHGCLGKFWRHPLRFVSTTLIISIGLLSTTSTMETYSSGEDLLIIKTRKPYTITKHREKWTEEEHNRFLEALKLYGRAWQRIEEYIGTKTAVQIRSHAQKFFTKLEKEAHIKGVTIRQTLEIEIPPPRPKRKPSNPYPRNKGVGTPASQVGVKDGKLFPSASSSCTGKQIIDIEKEPLPEKHGGYRKPESANGNQDEEYCSEIITLSQTAPCTSSSSAGKNSLSTPVAPRSLCTFREFVPMITPVNHDETSESHITAEPKGYKKFVKPDTKPPIQDNGRMGNTSNLRNPTHLQEKMAQGWTTAEQMQPENVSSLSSNDMQATQKYPRHVPVHVLDRTVGMNIQNISLGKSYHESMFQQIGGVNGYPNLFANPVASATIERHNPSKPTVDQSSTTFHPLFNPVQKKHDGYGSLLPITSTFSSLIASTLLLNPAAHAAASFAATFWPCANTGASADSLTATPTLGSLPSPSMAAIAAATVAAATAWWASHGVLPFCAPFQTGFTCNPAFTTDTCQNAAADNERRENLLRDPEKSEALQEQPSASKSLTLSSSSSDSEESEGAKRHSELALTNHDKVAGVTELHDSNNVKSRKPVDRSSCGSNTASSSEVETDALEKYEKGMEQSKEADAGHSAGDSNNRRGRSSSNINDSWKEVSEGGRLAFQALFSRQVLPQSFSPQQDLKSKGHQKISFEKDKQNMDEKVLDFNSETGGACSSHQRMQSTQFLGGENNGEGGLLTIGIGQGKLKARRTGFKPYKRCLVEAEEIMVATACSQGEEKGPKRIRLEGKAST